MLLYRDYSGWCGCFSSRIRRLVHFLLQSALLLLLTALSIFIASLHIYHSLVINYKVENSMNKGKKENKREAALFASDDDSEEDEDYVPPTDSKQ